MRSARGIAALALVAAMLLPWVVAAEYPSRPIRMIVPYAAGGGTDLVARPLAQQLSDRLGQQVVVDNRGGANGAIGMELAAKAQPDGHTAVLALTAQLAINPAFYAKLSYDPVRDYAAVALLGTAPYLLTVNPSLPAQTLKELVALARAKPGGLAFASSGAGGIPHLAGEVLKRMAGVDIVHVPYKGGGPALIDVIAGQVQMNFAVVPVAMTHVRAGRLRSIAVTSAKRFRGLPDVPAMSETLPGYEVSTWYGVLVPAGTPRAAVTVLNAAILRALEAPELRGGFLAGGFEPSGSTPEGLAGHVRSEIARWGTIVRESGASAR